MCANGPARAIRRHCAGQSNKGRFGATIAGRDASTEGFNNKIRWLVKQAYGYRDYKYFRLKILDLPNLKSDDTDY